MNKKLILPGALVLSGLVLRFFFTGVGYIACAVVTSEYHIYRAKLLAQSLDVSVGSVAARTTYVPIMINYFIREAFGVTYQLVFC